MTEKNVNIKVGFFVAIGVLTLVISIFAISGDQPLFADQYRIKVKFTESTGLSNGSVIAVMGFPVGNVEKIDFEPGSLDIDVTMRVLEKYKSKIPVGSIADVRTSGALGDKYIYITPSSSSEIVKEYGYIVASKEQDMLAVLSENGHEIDRVFSILKKVDMLLDDLNGDRQAKSIMDGLSDTVAELSAISKNLGSMTSEWKKSNSGKDLSTAIKGLNNVIAKIDRGEGSVGALINDPSVHDALKRLLGAKSYNSTLKNVIRTSIKESESP